MKNNKKSSILTVSESLFNKFGINKTAVDEIAEEAEVAKGTIYNYFGNKEGVIKALIEEKIISFNNLIEKYISSDYEPIKALKTTLVEKIKIFKSSPFLTDNIFNRKKSYKSFFNELDSKVQNFMESIINSKLSEKLSSFDCEKLVETLTLFTKGLEEKVKSNMESISIEKIEEYFEFLIQSLIENQKQAFN